MKIKIILHGILREKLPKEARGQMQMEFEPGTTIKDIAQNLGLPRGIACAVNGQLERNQERMVVEGDEIRFFRPGAGG